MNQWAFYPVFIGTAISVVGWIRFVIREHDESRPATLSELAARTRENTRYFRFILWICGPMFGLTALFYVAPSLQLPILTISLVAMVVLEMFVGVFPPTTKRLTAVHGVIAYAMAAVMLVTAIMLALDLPSLTWIAWLLVGVMFCCAVMPLFQRKKFLVYELGFIFASHITLVVAAIAIFLKL